MKPSTTVYGLILCLALAGCSSSRATLEERAMLVPRGTRPVIKIGLIAPFEGRYRSLGYEVLYAVRLAVRERNAAGGLAGYMVELVALDDGNDPEAAATQAKKLDVDEQVLGAVGPISEAAVRAALPVLQESGLGAVTLASCALLPPFKGDAGAAFCLGATEATLSHALADRLPADARVAWVRAGPGDLGGALRDAGLKTREVVWGPRTLTALGEHPVDVLVYDGDVLDAARFLIEARQAGIDAPLWGGPSLVRMQLAQIAGDAAVGACYVLTAPIWGDLSPDSAFVVGYRENSGTAPGPWAALAYDAAHLLLDAVERAVREDGAPTREGVVAALDRAQRADGRLVFERGLRREAEVASYCYEPGDAYPGTNQR